MDFEQGCTHEHHLAFSPLPPHILELSFLYLFIPLRVQRYRSWEQLDLCGGLCGHSCPLPPLPHPCVRRGITLRDSWTFAVDLAAT